MISAAEVRRNVRGALMLARRRPDGLAVLDQGLDGTRRSFWAALPAFPAYAIMVMADPGWRATGPTIFIDAVTYVIAWTIFPVAMLWVTRALDRLDRWPVHVTAYNWLQLVTTWLWTLIVLLGDGRLMPAWLLGVLGLGAIALVLSMEYGVARIALRLGAGAALTVVALDLLLGYMLEAMAQALVSQL